MMTKLDFIIIIISFSVLGCKSTSLVKPPEVNSVFIYELYFVDSTEKVIEGSGKFDTMTVVSTGSTYQGKNNVLSFKVDSGVNPSIFLNYEIGGDVSEYVDGHALPGNKYGWITYPIATKSVTSFLREDSSITLSKTRHTLTSSITYAGTEKIRLAEHVFDAVVLTRQDIDENNKVTRHGKYWIDSGTGVLLKIYLPSYNGAGIGILRNFTLK
jgi:hypothetical protein